MAGEPPPRLAAPRALSRHVPARRRRTRCPASDTPTADACRSPCTRVSELTPAGGPASLDEPSRARAAAHDARSAVASGRVAQCDGVADPGVQVPAWTQGCAPAVHASRGRGRRRGPGLGGGPTTTNGPGASVTLPARVVRTCSTYSWMSRGRPASGRPASSRCLAGLDLHRVAATVTAGEGFLLVGRVGTEPAALERLARGAEVVHALRHLGALVGERHGVAVLVDAAQRLVHLDELTVRQALDVPGLDAVLEHLAVAALEAQADPVGQRSRRAAGARAARCARSTSSRSGRCRTCSR